LNAEAWAADDFIGQFGLVVGELERRSAVRREGSE